MAGDLFISGIGYELGAPVPVSEESLGCTRGFVEDLRADGMTVFHRSEVPGAVLAARAAARALAAAPGTAAPDDILFCSEAPGQRSSWVALDFRRELGADVTPTTVLGGYACANFVAGVRVARALVADAAASSTILLVTSDQHEPAGDSRILGDGLAVLSDAAAACVLTTEPDPAALRVVALSLRSIASLAATSVTFTDLKGSARMIKAAVGAALTSASLTREDIRWVLVNNYRPPSRRFLAFSAGFRRPPELPAAATSVGHCFVSDPLIALTELRRHGKLAPGDHVLVLATGGYSWASLILQCGAR